MKKLTLVVSVALVMAGVVLVVRHGMDVQAGRVTAAAPGQAATPADLDRLLAPIALYPDQLLAQMLQCAMVPAGVTALDQFLKSNSTLKGTDLQDAAVRDNFEPSFVAMALFPQVVRQMASNLDATTRLGQAFTADRTSVFESIQRLRKQASDAGTLKTTPQQEVETQTTSSGQQVIVIEPANPQIVYVPQYNVETVYVPTSTVVVQDNSADAAVAGLIGFTAGVAIGAAVNNNYYYGPYGWYGGAYMYNDAWDDYYDHREDARDDWQDHREDLVEERGDRRENQSEQRTDRQENRQENRPEAQGDRAAAAQAQRGTAAQSERATTAQRDGAAQRGTTAQPAARGTTTQTAASPAATTRGSGSYESRGYSQEQQRATTQQRAPTQTQTQQRSGTGSDAFSGYSSGKSERAASSRGQSSRSSSRGGRSGGGGRR